MTTTYTFQVSNHPEAGRQIPTKGGLASWRIVYKGPVASSKTARARVDQLSQFYRNARVFKGKAIHYAVLRA